MRQIFLIILLLLGFIGAAQEPILGNNYFGNFWQPVEKTLIKIKPDNKFQIVVVSSTPDKVTETPLNSGSYAVKNDTLILKLDDKKTEKFKVLQNLALKPLTNNNNLTSNWFLLKNKFDKNGRYLGEGNWLNNKSLSIWVYADKRYSDIPNPQTQKIDYAKILKMKK